MAACRAWLYFLIPNTRVKWRSALIAGLFTGIAYQLFQNAFIFLQKSIYSYNRIYGSFAVLPLFLVWVKISWQMVFFGAELSYAEQNIDSGKFDIERSGADSPRRKTVCHLALSQLIYRKHAAGQGATGIDELTNTLNLTRAETETALEDLLCAELIYETGESGNYLPALPPESTTTAEILEKLELCGNNKLPENLAAANEKASEFARMRKESTVNTPIQYL